MSAFAQFGSGGAGYAATTGGMTATDPRRRRAIRVWALVVAIVLLSLGDLWMTLTHLKGAGMGEANPIARYVIGFNSPALLAAWKCATVALACIIFVWARHRRTTEAACWACAGVLAALTVGWIQYANEAHKLTSTLPCVAQMESGVWVSMTARPEQATAHVLEGP